MISIFGFRPGAKELRHSLDMIFDKDRRCDSRKAGKSGMTGADAF